MEKYPDGIWFGKKHSKESLHKMKISAIGRGIGNTNSQYGTMWITNGVESKKINKTDSIPQGWFAGRKIKHHATSD
jgi:hypothetical protein